MSQDGSVATSGGSGSEASSPYTSQQHQKKSSKPSKARLTSAQKNTNHRDAENKRRDGIRGQFETLADMVPECHGQAKSEYVMLTNTAQYIENGLDDIRELVRHLDARGLPVKEEWRKLITDKDFGGANHHTPAMNEYAMKKQRAEAKKGSIVRTEGDVGDKGDEV
jgi:hypothetical protein